MKSISFVMTTAAVLAISGCASSKVEEPAPVATAPVYETAPRPAPVATPAPVTPAVVGPAAGSKADFQTKTVDRVYFDLDQYTLDSADMSVLQNQAAWLVQYPTARVQVEGNADERGTREYNIALGARRARAVADYLVSLGVASSRIDTVSFGKDRPMVEGHDEAAWSQNRNAHTNVVVEGAPNS